MNLSTSLLTGCEIAKCYIGKKREGGLERGFVKFLDSHTAIAGSGSYWFPGPSDQYDRFCKRYPISFQWQIQDFLLGGGGGAPSHWRGRRPLMQVLFGKKVCENERIGSRWGAGACAGGAPWIRQWFQ